MQRAGAKANQEEAQAGLLYTQQWPLGPETEDGKGGTWGGGEEGAQGPG